MIQYRHYERDDKLTKYERLLDEAENANMRVLEKYDLSGTRLKGLYCDNNIALSNELGTETEKCCTLAEEIGHHYTTFGNILDLSQAPNRKQEQQARTWAYNKLIGLMGIVNSYKAGCRNAHEMAEYLNVTEKFLIEALERYRSKYGTYTTVDNYVIFFEPNLGVLEIQK